jgi:hypothetical protein
MQIKLLPTESLSEIKNENDFWESINQGNSQLTVLLPAVLLPTSKATGALPSQVEAFPFQVLVQGMKSLSTSHAQTL